MTNTMDAKILWLLVKDICTCSKWFPYPEVVERRKLRVIDGDWDTPRVKPTGIEIFYESRKQHLAGTDLINTKYGKDFHKFTPQHAGAMWERCKVKWSAMYEDIKAYGYRWRPLPKDIYDEFILVDIGRDGDVFFHNGVHRLCFCMMLGVAQVPVKVMIRHKKWQDLRDKIEAYMAKNGGRVYATIDHPDLAEYPSLWDGWRLSEIRKHINPNSKTVLDIGAHWGHISFGLHEGARKCTAVESVAFHADMLDRLKVVLKKDVRLVREDLHTFIARENKFDTIIALNILHHSQKTEAGFKKLITLLGQLQGQEMFLMSSNPEETQMVGAYRNMGQEEFAFFVSEHSCFKRISYIGEQGGRRLFKLTK